MLKTRFVCVCVYVWVSGFRSFMSIDQVNVDFLLGSLAMAPLD